MIYFVEDDSSIRELVVYTLNNTGFEAQGMDNAKTLYEKISIKKPELILLDIMLPGKDGIKILKEIKDHPELKKGIVIALTNLNSENIIQEVFGSGADGYLIKSEITPDKVVEEVNRILANQEGSGI